MLRAIGSRATHQSLSLTTSHTAKTTSMFTKNTDSSKMERKTATAMVLTHQSHRSNTAQQGLHVGLPYMVRCNAGLHWAQLFPILKYPSAHEPHEIPKKSRSSSDRAHATNKVVRQSGEDLHSRLCRTHSRYAPYSTWHDPVGLGMSR